MKKVMMIGIDKVRGNEQKYSHMHKGNILKNVLILFSPYEMKEASGREKFKTSEFSSRDCGSSTQNVWISSGQMVPEY